LRRNLGAPTRFRRFSPKPFIRSINLMVANKGRAADPIKALSCRRRWRRAFDRETGHPPDIGLCDARNGVGERRRQFDQRGKGKA